LHPQFLLIHELGADLRIFRMHVSVRNESATEIRGVIVGHWIDVLCKTCERKRSPLAEHARLPNLSVLRRNRVEAQALTFGIDRSPNSCAIRNCGGRNVGIRIGWENGVGWPRGLRRSKSAANS